MVDFLGDGGPPGQISAGTHAYNLIHNGRYILTILGIMHFKMSELLYCVRARVDLLPIKL